MQRKGITLQGLNSIGHGEYWVNAKVLGVSEMELIYLFAGVVIGFGFGYAYFVYEELGKTPGDGYRHVDAVKLLTVEAYMQRKGITL